MKSRTAKVLHRVCGRSLVEHVVDAALAAGAAPVITVVGVQGQLVEGTLRESFAEAPLGFAFQRERRGTADAVLTARGALESALPGKRRTRTGDVLLLCGDVPALPATALRRLLSAHRRHRASLTVLTAEVDDPRGYGRIVRDEGGLIRAIVEQRDASRAERTIREINSGIYCAKWSDLVRVLERVAPDNRQGEYYLTDAVRLLIGEGLRVQAVSHPVPEEISGVNSREQLSEIGRLLNKRFVQKLLDGGVTVVDPDSAWIDAGVRVGSDSVLYPGVILEGSTRLGRSCVVHSGVRLRDVTAGNNVLFLDHSVALESRVGSDTKIGPFAHMRPGSVIGPECKIGNFVETKKTRMGRGSKAPHLTYLGDAVIGKRVNVGAGTITCNYDGVRKSETRLGDGVFIGSDTQLVAPVRLGKGSYVAAGTTVTKDVPEGALAISRTSQRNLEGWVEKRRHRRDKGGDR
jgi:bifunctional UDP-N-acetylglucosamine pyrophosphorylase/glucosamine-1-phosphate N-acetyltransferase